MAKTEKAFCTGVHCYSFRSGEQAEIIGVKMVTPLGHDTRPCFHVKFNDGREDYIPIVDRENYSIELEKKA